MTTIQQAKQIMKLKIVRTCDSIRVVSMTLASVAFLVGSSFCAQAQLISYDGFDYTPDTSVANGSGGTGWGATWGNVADAASALATNTSTGLSYGGLVTSGGAVIVGNPVGTTGTTAQPQRQLPDTFNNLVGGAGGTIWVSFLYQNLNNDLTGLLGFRETGLRLMSGSSTNAGGWSNRNGTDRLDAGSPNTYPTGANFDQLTLWTGSTFGTNGFATPRGPDPANTVFIVLRLDFDNTTAADTGYAWFNPSLGLEPLLSTAVTNTAADLTSVNALRFQSGNQNGNGTNAVWILDEVRVGLSWADVSPIPEPTVFVLGGLGALALLLRKRGRSRN